MPDPTFTDFLRAQASALRAGDAPPVTRAAWAERRAALRAAVQAAAGPVPATPCDLKPQVLGTLDRDGYRIEKLVFQSRPDVWVTANVYVPTAGSGKRPAVLAVHGHHAWARIDPDVQAYCLGLVKLGFVVLCVDAFGAGERHANPARGTYHGALDGAALWPVGQTLLGMQVYDNRRAVDYLLTRPEVDPDRIGITGASGGGNQSMYAGALDERLKCVVPVCSVGNYQAYFHVACCVCEVLPGALRFTEEGDVLGLVAPRSLLVINASKDSIQFSPAEAAKSVARARHIYDLSGDGAKLRHTTVEGGHGYSKAMREAMYGWMTRWLKGEGTGEPIPDPQFKTEDPQTIRCFPDIAKRPEPWLTPTSFAKRTGEALLKENFRALPDHAEEWESTAVFMRERLAKILSEEIPSSQIRPKVSDRTTTRGITKTKYSLSPEPGLSMVMSVISRDRVEGKQPICVKVHLDGENSAHAGDPLAEALVDNGWVVVAPNLRGTGDARPANDSVRSAIGHNSSEHALWIGRPLFAQWLTDVRVAIDWVAEQEGYDRRRIFLAGEMHAGMLAIAAGGLWDKQIAGVIAEWAPVSFLAGEASHEDWIRMGLLAPGIVSVGDMPQFAAMVAPRRLVIAGGLTHRREPLTSIEMQRTYEFTSGVYKTHKAAERLTIEADPGKVNFRELVKSF